MAITNQRIEVGEFVLAESRNSREVGSFAAGQRLEPGTVVSRITEPELGEFYALDPTATDGRQIVAGVLRGRIDTADGPQKSTYIAGDAELAAWMLAWPADISADKLSGARARMESLRLTLRSEG